MVRAEAWHLPAHAQKASERTVPFGIGGKRPSIRRSVSSAGFAASLGQHAGLPPAIATSADAFCAIRLPHA